MNMPVTEDRAGTGTGKKRAPVKLQRLMAVVDRFDDPTTDRLLRKATRLAEALRADLELFHVCHDSTLAPGRFLRSDESEQQRNERVDAAATRLAEVALEVQAESGLEVAHDTRWGAPPAAVIIRKAQETGADLIIKASSASNYVVGLLTNTDWELIRRSPAHVWFVAGDTGLPRQILAAVGSPDDEEEIFGSGDYDTCAFARLLSDSFDTRSNIVHTYEVPMPAGGIGQLASSPMGSTALAEARSAQRAALTGKRRQAVQTLVDYFHLDTEDIHVVEGRTSDVITEMAGSLGADAIVMGAASLNRVERFLKPVAAEPVLARAECDVIFVREPIDEAELPEPAERPLRGLPVVDLERAVINPDIEFNHSPAQLVTEDRLSVTMRRRLLQLWESDLRAEMTEEDEGGPTGSSRANMLAAIHQARELLEEADATDGDGGGRSSKAAVNPEFS